MCEHGDSVLVQVTVPAAVSYSGCDVRRLKPIDRCIVDIVRALDSAGVQMLGSCCGHGKRDGEIPLADGRLLTIASPVVDVPGPPTESEKATDD